MTPRETALREALDELLEQIFAMREAREGSVNAFYEMADRAFKLADAVGASLPPSPLSAQTTDQEESCPLSDAGAVDASDGISSSDAQFAPLSVQEPETTPKDSAWLLDIAVRAIEKKGVGPDESVSIGYWREYPHRSLPEFCAEVKTSLAEMRRLLAAPSVPPAMTALRYWRTCEDCGGVLVYDKEAVDAVTTALRAALDEALLVIHNCGHIEAYERIVAIAEASATPPADAGERRAASAVPVAPQEESPYDIVGHKTVSTGRVGPFGFPEVRHEPLTRAEADALIAESERTMEQRAANMPNEQTALAVFFDAWQRLKELGWRDAIYCPKDGTIFDAIEAGSTGIHDCSYQGEWPRGGWWIHADGDLCPSYPVLFRLKPEPVSPAAEER